MKYIFSLVLLAGLGMLAKAQTEGRIRYEEKVDVHRRIPEERAEMKEMIPRFRSSFFNLFYTAEASKYKAQEVTDDEEVTRTQGDTQFRMRMAQPRREVYKNLAEDKMVDEREFMTKMFLIKGSTSPYQWKILDGQKKILDMLCLQASSQDSVNTYVVWFTPQIPVSNGPAEFGGLPGMILQVDINQGERILTATELAAETVDPALLEEPTKGKEVTQEEFHAIVREKMQEMREMHGGGGQMMMIRHD